MAMHIASMALVACKPRIVVCKARFATSASACEQGQRSENNDNLKIPSCERSSDSLQIMPGQLILITWIA
jgi:hypothetical protein